MTRQKLAVWATRAAAWFCIVLIAILSLVPARLEIRTGWLPGLVEHVLAYMGTAAFLAGVIRPGLGGGLWRPFRLTQVALRRSRHSSRDELRALRRLWRVELEQCSVPLVLR